MEIIATRWLILRSPVQSDLQVLYDHILSDDAVMQRAFRGGPMTWSQSGAFFDRDFDHEATGKKLGLLIERASGQTVGFAGLLECDVLDEQDYEIGFVLRRSAWGKGYATEIGRGQIKYGLIDLKLPRLIAQVAPDNAASIAVLNKIGMSLLREIENPLRGRRQVYVVENRS
jgi:RimJ/RimL family protein N-acetyltransferase